MTSQEVVEFVRERLKDEEKRKKPSLVCEEVNDKTSIKCVPTKYEINTLSVKISKT